jgi:hypothetical protein
MRFILNEARDTFRQNGSYLNRLRRILATQDKPLTESEWRETVGNQSFEEAQKYGLLTEEEVEREGPMLIKEKPPVPPSGPKMGGLKVKGISTYVKGDTEIIIADVQNNEATGRVRLARRGNDNEFSTDNLDLIDAEMCQDLDGIQRKIWTDLGDKEPFGEDPGKFPYHVRSRCSASGAPTDAA